jgi:hypothetical protein
MMTSDHYLKSLEQKMGHNKKKLQGREKLKEDMIMLKEVQDVEKIGKKCLEHKRSKEKALQKFNEICGLPNVVLNNTMQYMQHQN